MNCFSSKCAALLLIVRPVSSDSVAFVEAFENPDIPVSETKESVFFVLFFYFKFLLISQPEKGKDRPDEGRS